MNGLLFTEPNFRLTLERLKTNTRRPVSESILLKLDIYEESNEYVYDNNPLSSKEFMLKHAKYKKGDILFLKEPYNVVAIDAVRITTRISLRYSASEFVMYYKGKDDIVEWCAKRHEERSKSKSGWCNKMFMPSWIAKQFIEITDVKCERLQDISDEDCISEGITQGVCSDGIFWGLKLLDGTYLSYSKTPKEAYRAIWESINGKGSWDLNPWVHSYHYKLL